MNLKKVFSGVIACSALFVLAACQQESGVTTNPSKNQQQNSSSQTAMPTSLTVGSQQFNLPNLNVADQSAYQEAVANGDAKGCDQIKDSKYKQQCQAAVADAIALNAALSKSDVSMCSKLSSREFQQNCQDQVQLQLKKQTGVKQYDEQIENEQKLAAQIIAGGDYNRCKELKIEGIFSQCEVDILTAKSLSTKDISWCEKASTQNLQAVCKMMAGQ